MIHLDTSFLIRALIPGSREDSALRAWLATDVHVATSAVAWAEFLCGPVTAEVVDLAREVVGEPLPFAEGHAQLAASLFNASGRRRGTLVDCMVAAAAVAATADLATSNQSDFARLAPFGVRLARQ